MTDSELERFIDKVCTHRADAESELRSGRKQTHWMWFMFPQLRELGVSPTAIKYGIVDLDEAMRYLSHEQLGGSYSSLLEIVHRHVVTGGFAIGALFGSPDDRKLVSSLTLFRAAAQCLGLEQLARTCTEVLEVSEQQGYQPCATTLSAVAGR
jgi:uncharacterized protein (DUF1810 family)